MFINILILERLNAFLKSKESKFFTFDQAIEKVLEKIKLENELEKLIKSFVNLNKRRTSLDDANSSNDSHNYYSLADLNSKRPQTPEFIFLEHVFCLIKFSKLNEMMLTYQDLFGTFLDKLNRLVKTNPNKLVTHVGSTQFDFELFWKLTIKKIKIYLKVFSQVCLQMNMKLYWTRLRAWGSEANGMS